MFDEQPDGDPHGECAAEIQRLREALAYCRASIRGAHMRGPNFVDWSYMIESIDDVLGDDTPRTPQALTDALVEHLAARCQNNDGTVVYALLAREVEKAHGIGA